MAFTEGTQQRDNNLNGQNVHVLMANKHIKQIVFVFSYISY